MKKKLILSSIILIPIVFLIIMYLNSYTIKEAIENNDFITYPEQINIERFNKFIDDIKNNEDSRIRITEFSKEGNPRVNDIKYSDNKIILHSFYPNNLFNKEHKTLEYTKLIFEDIGNHRDLYLLNENSGIKIYICQIRGD